MKTTNLVQSTSLLSPNNTVMCCAQMMSCCMDSSANC